MNVSDVLEQAADLLWVRGRSVGVGEAPDGSLCVLGAMLVAQDQAPHLVMHSYSHPARVALERFLFAEGCDSVSLPGSDRASAWIWSDRLRVCPENDALVIDTLRACAKQLRKVES